MNMLNRYFLAGVILLTAVTSLNAQTEPRVRVAIAGMAHGHVNGFLRKDYRSALEVVGIYETNQAVAQKYQARYDLDPSIFTTDLSTLLDEKKPQAVWVFSNTFAHLEVVEACAPRGIHVIVEKPLAVDMASASRMAALAKQHGTYVLTNLETTWYSSLHEAHRISVGEKKLGEITKIVSHFGHKGPAEIGVPPEFFAWLTDPVLNGGGASADFGCYGGDIITWLLGNQRPLSVTATFQTNKPGIYKVVDDNATIILEYPKAQGIIQASWDWPFPRKDVHIYGRSGIIRTIDDSLYDIRLDRGQSPTQKTARSLPESFGDSVEYFAAVLRGEIDPKHSLSSLETNLIAMEIMEAARESAKTGQAVVLSKVRRN
ncbi:MAG: Gfo/Idh/MocA family oxidoreductase [Verrucomicrobia bacterium]|nr:Gfo/Idh/MocA family oxidoreductase [Verrucomicrobiota bacterium]